MFKKLLAILMVVLMAAGLLAGCNTSTSKNASKTPTGTSDRAKEQITLNVWYTYPENNTPGTPDHMLKKIAENYMKENPNVKVNMVGNATTDKTLTALVGGQGPDIFLNLWPNVATWSQKGVLLDLTDYVNNDKEFDKNDILPSAWKLATFKGRIYGIPNEINSSEIYYNKDLLKAAGFDGPPETMEDLINMAYKLTKTDANGNIIQLGFLPDFPWRDDVLWPIVYGANWIDEKANKITFDTPEMKAAYQWQVDIYKKYGVDKLQKFKSGFGSDAQDP
ncbi:MAG: extracellular solute-binding protein, partial [Thermoanaerobacterium sp.]|nr:extracellular solute-binding protein [Thermoanaerobacterium sp.]